MHLKKTIYTLASTLMLSALLGGIAKAIPMKDVFNEIVQKMKPGKQVIAHIQKLQSYLEEESPRTKPTLTGLDPISMIRRKDSIAFGIFCCMCYKKNWTNYIRYAAERRNVNDRKEDIEVLENIFPGSINGPDGLLALCDRLEINPDDITIDSYDRAQLIAFVNATPVFESGEMFESEEKEEAPRSEPRSGGKFEKGKRFKVRKRLTEIDIVSDPVDFVSEAVLSPRSRRRQKRMETAASASLDGGKPFPIRKRRNKPNCLSTLRDDSKKCDQDYSDSDD